MDGLYFFIAPMFFILSVLPTNIFQRKKKKNGKKKEKRKPFIRRAGLFCQGFLEKYYPTKEVWRFFQKPKGLDLSGLILLLLSL